MKYRYLFSTIALVTTSCATMNESLQLGAGLGAMSGAAATYAAERSTGHEPPFENVALGAGIGLAVGLITSHIVHRSVEERRQSFQADQTEMHFGDLPPSPFIVPKMTPKKGER